MSRGEGERESWKAGQEVRILASVPEGAVRLGEGDLSWCRYERVGDRYGTVGLFDGDFATPLAVDAAPARGHLLAEVLETKKSDHIGDLFHGVGPGGAVAGEVVALNPVTGTVYIPTPADTTAAADRHGDRIGVSPDDDRAVLWLSLLALYRVHGQRVRLWACEEIPEPVEVTSDV